MEKIDQLLEKSAKFRKVAFHVHSPISHDWTGGNKETYLTKEGKESFLQELDKRFDLVVVVDHMRCSYGCELSEISKSRKGVKIFPGMEISFEPEPPLNGLKVHLVVVFPMGTSVEKIGRIFSGIAGFKDENERKGKEVIDGKLVSLKDWIKKVHDENGICIAAHVEHENGIRFLFRQTAKDTIVQYGDSPSKQDEQRIAENFREYLLISGIDAIEVARPQDRIHYIWESKIKETKYHIPVVLGMDSHDLVSLDREEKITYIKLNDITLAQVKDAFRFPDTRIRFCTDLPRPCCPTIIGIEILGSKGNSFFPNLTVGFTENLNCVIGARGSGKSTLIEAIRYVFGYNQTLNEVDQELVKKIRSIQKRNFKDAKLKIYYKTNKGEVHTLEATFDEKIDYLTKVFNEDGDQIAVPNIEASGNYPLRLFGWSEIENLGREHKRQRDLLDRLIPEVLPKLQEKKEIIGELTTNRKSIERVCTELDNIFEQSNREVQRYREYKEEFKKLNTADVKLLLESLDGLKSKKTILNHVLGRAKFTLGELNTIERPDFLKGLNEIVNDQKPEIRQWWEKDEGPSLNILTYEEEVKASIEKAVQKVNSLIKSIESRIVLIESNIVKVNKEIREKVGLQSTEDQVKIDHREQAEKRLDRVKQIRQKYIEKKKDLDKLLAERVRIVVKLQTCIDIITSTRVRSISAIEEKLNKFKVENLNISIAFKASGDTEKYINALDSFLSRTHGKYKAKKLPEIFANNFSPIALAEVFLRNGIKTLVGKSFEAEGKQYIIDEDYVNKLVDLKAYNVLDEYSELEKIKKDELLSILEFQEIDLDDYVSIMLNRRPVESLSPGQRSSAMLPLIVLSENAPLVIDQPEDNLDNKLVGQVLVNILAELKEKRQLIIATHNPNILVLGDAEQVVVLNAINDMEGKVDFQASIDDQDIITTVIDIMEGGKQAFEARNARYAITRA
jgi:ABC-type lipoprotein export system ATPase subunit